MKNPCVIVPCLFVVLAACSCQSVSVADQGSLSRAAMSFNVTGARSADCGLSTQIERGRSLTSASASGGCASCH